MKLIPESIQEAINFKRRVDPKKSLDIGLTTILKKITSEDLEQLESGWDPDKQQFSEEIYRESMEDFAEEMPEEYQEGVEWLEKVGLALRGKIEYGVAFDWKEQTELLDYLLTCKPQDKPHAYHGMVDSDMIGVVWTGVELPNATPVEYEPL